MRVLSSAIHAISSVFGCQHDRLTRPFTIQQQSYMMCLDCGHKIFYSTEEMRQLSRREVRRLRADEVSALHLPATPGKPAHAVPNDPTLAA